ncbi:unnamed protein product [Penicillium salamii]|uniref:Uncharacterized protein n=1 Tax=Penicillium salamii TaxID=1612424 RepID=A0A9W4NP96_9EURO|nr:unnamed protein product [Penicillium salamii]CAG8148528.1 unnamed protein product [Penicillium salamii]CAG8377917.1 unnamed protein product [Penicillium salamii]CAG8379353.1 unnamed protein product [Penicillium salamii]CAG8382796.1 unnamed protein product [Penicillium salamii]
MADYTVDGPLQEFPEWDLYHISECLEDHSIRHCIAGDAIITTLGYPLVICDFYLAVADEHLEDALTVVLQQGFQEIRGRDFYVDKDAIITPSGWPGHRLKMTSASPISPAVVLVPSSFWHIELSELSLSTNTFLHPSTRCRFPKRLFYLDALIDIIVEAALKPGGNRQLSRYFRMQYHYLLACLSPDTLLSLPLEDKFFVDLYGRLLPPSTRQKVCFNRQRIRQGLISVDEAWKSIPRKALLADEIWRKSRNHS